MDVNFGIYPQTRKLVLIMPFAVVERYDVGRQVVHEAKVNQRHWQIHA